MNFQFYFEKLMGSEEFERFKTESPDAYPCSCFFSLDFEGNDNKQHFDYFVPSTGKMYSFKLEDNCSLIQQEMLGSGVPTKISDNHIFDFNDIQRLIEKRMELEKVKGKILKLLYSLQNVDNRDYFVGTIFLSGMALLKVHISLEEQN